MSWKTASWIAFIALVLTIMVMAMTHSLFADNPALLGVQVLALLLMIWARLHLRLRSFHAGANPTEGGLITSGPYRYIRHPIYASIFYFLLISLVTHLSVQTCLLVLTAYACLAMRIAGEEQLLVQRYPDYTAYASRVKRVIPFVL